MSTRNPSIFWGGLLVVIGVLALLGNLNVKVGWDVLAPVLLIALGVWLLVDRIGPGGATTGADFAEAREGLDKARLDVAIGAGRLAFRSARLGDQLYQVHVDHTGAPTEVTLDRSSGTLRIAQRGDWFMGGRRLRIDATLSDAIPWAVSCATGAVRADFDLSSATLSGFLCRTGASNVDLELGTPKGAVPVRLEGGALTVRITRPAGIPVQVEASGASVQVRGDGTRQEGLGSRTWKSDGFDAATGRYEVTISGAALNVDVSGR